MKLFKKAKKGFTLVELVVVIAVIAILAAVSVGAYFGVTNSANQSKAEQEGKAFHTNLILLANTPNNGICKLTSAGLTFEETKDIDDAVEKIAGDNGISYDEYTIVVTDHDTDDVFDCLSFTTPEDYTALFDIVTGATCEETHA